jgi:hypothetical protein
MIWTKIRAAEDDEEESLFSSMMEMMKVLIKICFVQKEEVHKTCYGLVSGISCITFLDSMF